MLRSDNLFGKRDSNTASTANTPAQPFGSSLTSGSTGGISRTTMPASLDASAKTAPEAAPATSSTNEMGSKLIVGPNIKLKGVEITDCDTLVVEGRVEATMDSRVIQIAECGAFKGSAEIDIAEIRGEFDGDLTVRQKLVIYATGKVTGKIRYGKVVIEEGGQLAGDVQVGTTAAAASKLSVAKAS
ncbi:cytoskeletal protein CcmA (bactofilin family) [Paucimonas lemoignei]|uniref:Cytoskeletal protein CcmA (Bactofilin family) n=1 Tax=Paucimonas lemoignei TaxID=29443 RepID=A0A4R3HT66_PAULE|nr:polymer-forming cytoskeletal protein [Paucimonas lemoignei]TCS34014.1 cytoskeletal protein CcmA (bactofilin family) [Paucimonas lemoignei]